MHAHFLEFLRKSYLTRTALFILLLFIVPLGILTNASMYVSRTALETEVNQIHYGLVEQIAERNEQLLSRARMLVHQLSLTPAIRQAARDGSLRHSGDTFNDLLFKQELLRIFASFKATNEFVYDIGFYSPSGDVLLSLERPPLRLDHSAYAGVIRSYWQLSPDGEPLYLNIDTREAAPSLLSDTTVLIGSVPSGSQSGHSAQSIVLLAIRNAAFGRAAENVRLGENASFHVLTPAGRILAGPPAAEASDPVRQQQLVDRYLSEWRQLGENKQFSLDEALISVKPTDSFLFLSAIPIRQLTAPLRELNRTLWILAASITALALGSLVVLGFFFYRPLQMIMRHLRRVANGRFESRLGLKRSDELGELANMMDEMTARLGEAVEEMKRTEQQKIRSEIRALQAQINPHFLHNCLNAIQIYVTLNEPNKVKTMMEQLSALLRYSMNSGETLVEARNELAYISRYIRLMELRYGRTLGLRTQLAPSLADIPIPRLLLQPLVENALFHGLLAVEREDGFVAIRLDYADERGGQAVLEVADNGAGMTEARLQELRLSLAPGSKQERIGLFNVWERIRLVYGSDSAMEIDSREGEGTTVRFRFRPSRR